MNQSLLFNHVECYLTYDDVLMLPNYSEITPPETDTTSFLTPGISLKIPLVSAPMDTVTEGAMLSAMGRLGALGIIHRNLTVMEQVRQLKQVIDSGLPAGAAVGVGIDLVERVNELARCSPTVLCIDSAHGHTKNVINAAHYIKTTFPDIPLIAGNIATYEGAKALFDVGVDIVKVGMGSGSICTTRIMSGMGAPQFSALVEVSRAAKEYGKTFIADGGVRTSGDVVKALAIGASAVMLGSLLAGTDASPGEVIEINHKKYKSYRGMGSVESMKKGCAARYGQHFIEGQANKLVPEGIEGFIEYRGTIDDHVHQIQGGIKAGMAYLGVENLHLLREKAKFIRITPAGMAESHPHSITVIKS